MKLFKDLYAYRELLKSNIKKDIEKIGYASLLLDLTNQVIKHGSSDNLFYNLSNALIKIDEGLNPNVITIIVMLKYLDNLGVAPVLDCCLECGNTNIATISSYRGGFVCKNCLKDEEIMSEKAIKLLKLSKSIYYHHQINHQIY